MSLEILTAASLAPIRHGFFTRRGGASSGVFAGLNCGAGSSDQAEVVAINRARVAAALEVPPEALIGVHQVHSSDVAVVGPAGLPPGIRADALVTDRPGLALSVLTADCLPVLLADREAGVIGAVHAGWRGLLRGVIEAALGAMAGLGARPERTVAAIGPCISQRAYEVGPELLAAFEAEDPEAGRFFAAGRGDRLLFDLPGLGLARLRALGVAQSEWTGHCTYSDADRFYSFRRSTHLGEADYGRLISAIRL
jgi:YfiH family protein